MRKPLPNALDIDLRGGLTEEVTPHAGVGLLIELGRRSGVMAAAERHLPKRKSSKGLGQGQWVESFVLLSALGGECLDDFDGLRRDYGLAALLGYHLPAASTARQWLDRFHRAEVLAERPQQGSFIPRETDQLAGLQAVVQRTVQAYVAVAEPGPEVTLDVDAHLVESAKETALPTYAGFRGYQPLLVSWAETNLILADEFRDGNVPAGKDLIRVVDAAYASLPQREGDWQADACRVRVRSDSAAYDQSVLDHWAGRGWTFAVSANMTPQLRAEIVALGPEAWQPWTQERDGMVREWAEVPYVPSRKQERRDTQPYRYLAIRIRPPQGVLFGDGSAVRHFAVTGSWEVRSCWSGTGARQVPSSRCTECSRTNWRRACTRARSSGPTRPGSDCRRSPITCWSCSRRQRWMRRTAGPGPSGFALPSSPSSDGWCAMRGSSSCAWPLA